MVPLGLGTMEASSVGLTSVLKPITSLYSRYDHFSGKGSLPPAERTPFSFAGFEPRDPLSSLSMGARVQTGSRSPQSMLCFEDSSHGQRSHHTKHPSASVLSRENRVLTKSVPKSCRSQGTSRPGWKRLCSVGKGPVGR